MLCPDRRILFNNPPRDNDVKDPDYDLCGGPQKVKVVRDRLGTGQHVIS